MAKLIGAAVGAVRSGLRVDRTKLSVGAALRASVGIAIPLAAGAATGQLLIGVTIAIGALAGGIASLQGTYRSRARLVVVASAGMGLSAFVGATLGHIVGLDIVVIAVWGFAAGLLVIFGQAPTVVGLQAVVGVVVFSQFTFSLSGAARQGALVVAGGILQAILVTAVWPLRRFPAERAVLSNAYRRLSDYARFLTTTPTSLMPPGSMDDLGTALRDPQPFGGRAEMAAYQALLDQVERVRLDLAGLARGRQRLSATDSHGAAKEMDTVAQISAGVLGEVSDAVRAARAARPALEEWAALDAAIDRLRTAAGYGGSPGGGGPDGGGPDGGRPGGGWPGTRVKPWPASFGPSSVWLASQLVRSLTSANSWLLTIEPLRAVGPGGGTPHGPCRSGRSSGPSRPISPSDPRVAAMPSAWRLRWSSPSRSHTSFPSGMATGCP